MGGIYFLKNQYTRIWENLIAPEKGDNLCIKLNTLENLQHKTTNGWTPSASYALATNFNA